MATDEHTHDDGECCECGGPHCCCECPAFMVLTDANG